MIRFCLSLWFLAFSQALNLFQHSFWDFFCAKAIQAKFATIRIVRRQIAKNEINISPLCAPGIVSEPRRWWKYENIEVHLLLTYQVSNIISFEMTCVFTNFSDLSFLTLSQNGVLSSSLASRLVLTQSFIFNLLFFP